MTQILVYSANADLERTVREALEGSATVVRVDSLDSLGSGRGELPEVVLVGDDVSLDYAYAIAANLDRERPEISVLLVAERTSDTLASAMRVGARDVIEPDAVDVEVRRAVNRAADAARARRRVLPTEASAGRPAGRVITVASPKGGSGKTTVATNLAVEFGHRVPGEAVIVDLDLQFGDVASSLRIEPEHDVVDAVGALGSDDLVLKSYLTAHPSGCYALCAPEAPDAGENVTGKQVLELLERLAAGFRYIIVDTAPGLAEYTLGALEASSHPVLLAGMDVPSVRGLRREMAVLSELGLVSSDRRLVLNFVDRRSGMTLVDVEELLGEVVDVVVPRSRSVPISTNRGVPLLDEGSKDPVARALVSLADQLDARSVDRSRRRGARRDRGHADAEVST